MGSRCLDGFWKTLTKPQLEGIEAVAMDMEDPYVDSVRAHVKDADGKIVFDKFHLAQYLSKAVDSAVPDSTIRMTCG
jgi:transposase